MSSYRRHATRPDAAERAMRQVLRHRMETYAEPFPDGSMYIGTEDVVLGMESLRSSLENWPVPDLSPLFRSQALPPAHDLMGCTGAWNQYRSGRRKCSDCGEEMSPVPKPEPGVVGYRCKENSRILRCLLHPLSRGEEIPVTSEDLENGGMCTWCGNDLLTQPGVDQ